MSESIVDEWLRSRNLSEYTVAFIDNGYDDLEICKQIGDPDLDAIGVTKAEHRAKLLSAVKTLREEGGTAVYFTLENPNQSFDNEFSDDFVFAEIGPAPGSPESTRKVRAHSCTPKTALLTYPKLQLRHILNDKIAEDDVDLTNPPYTNLNLTVCRSSLTALAVKYATELKTHVDDVYDRMEELRWRFVRKDNESYYSPALGRPPGSIYSTSIYGHTTGPVPPPIPSCPPPSMSHMDRYADLQSVSTRYDRPNFHPNYVALETGMCCMFPRKTKKVTTDKEDEKKKTSTIGKFFKNISFRKSSRKHGYKPATGDLPASEITMSDEDRMALMLMVKDGIITTDTALEVVRRFEEEKKQDGDSICSLKSEDSTEREIGKKKRSCSTKPTKSPSAIYSDEGSRCEICQNYVSRDHAYQHSQTCQDSNNRLECCRHRRVHSVSHIEYLQQSGSHHFTRAMSCSPTNSPPTHPSTVGSPVMFHSPIQYGKIYSPALPQDLKLHVGLYSQAGYNSYKDGANLLKTAAYVHKTPSKSSILSSESDHSMECSPHGALPVDMAATRNDDGNYCSNSTVSTSSDTSPAPINRQNEAVADRSRLHKWHRSGSYSTGEDDGMSSENENIDKASYGSAYHRSKTKSHQVKSDMKKKMLRSLNVEEGEISRSGVVYQTGTNKSVSSMESNHSQTSGLGSQPSASPGSGRSHTPEDLYNSQFIGKAKVLSNYSPTAEEVHFLHLKESEIIKIISMSHTGTWKGMLNGKVGYFHLGQTEIITEMASLYQRKDTQHQQRSQKLEPTSVEELMRRIGLEHLTSVFLLNGYDKLEKFVFMDEHDLNILNIHDPKQRTRILTALELLLDYDAVKVTDSYNKVTTPSGVEQVQTLHTGHRDSGCYGSSEHIIHRVTDIQSSKVQKSSYSENKENHQPNHRHYCVKSSDDMSSSIYSSDSTRVNSEFDRSDKEYTEEDKEVGEITKYFSSGKKKLLSNSIGSKPIEEQIVMYLCSSTQTSPSCGTSCEQPMFSQAASMLCQGASSDKNGVIETTSSDSSLDLSPHKKPKPFPKKICATIGPRCDAQVQVMSPMSSQIYAPCKSVLKDSKIQSDSKCCGRKSKSPSLLNGYMQSTISTSDSKKSGSSERWTKMGHNQPTSIYGPVQKNYKSIRKSLVPLVTSKLAQEKIDLKQEPYSSKTGSCGIPPLLIQRYADELKQDTRGVAAVMDQVRIHQLSSLGKIAAPANNLEETSTTACDLNISSINSFFTSIGLPMYTESFIRHRCTAMEQLVTLKEREIEEWTKADAKHVKRICHALEWVCGKLSSPSRKSKLSSVKDRV